MKWLVRVSLIITCVFCENAGRAQVLTVSVTAFSSSTGATIVATAPPSASVTLEQASSMGGFTAWSVLTSHIFGTNSTWQFQDSGATGVGQRYYRLRSNALWLGGGQVYSVNITGFARLNAASGVTLLANPLLATNNTVAVAFPNPENGFSLFRLTPTGYEVNNYLFGWTAPSMSFAPGEGFFLRNPSASPATLSFFGEVPMGTQNTPIPAGQSLLSSKIPQSGPLESALGFPSLDGDLVYRWDGSSFSLFFYDQLSGGWDPSDPTLQVGQAFWLETSVSRNWTRNFSPNFAPAPENSPADLSDGDLSPDLAPAGGSPGQVNFFTYNLNTSFGRVFDSDETTPAGASYVGQLFAGSANSEGSLSAVGAAVAFSSGQAAGYINSGLVSVPGISAGQPIYLQLRVWEGVRGATYAAAVANGSKNGKSAIFSVTAVAPPSGSPTPPPPGANGFASFNLVAPPSPPQITVQPTNFTALAGGNASFSVTATGLEPMRYQWRFNLTNTLQDATNATLVLANVQSAQAGTYDVVVTNGLGNVTSAAATLSVLRSEFVYWTTRFNGRLKRARPNGTGVETVMSNAQPPGAGVAIFGGIAIDRGRGHLFTGDGSQLVRANLDGSGRTNLVSIPFDSIAQRGVTDVELDLINNRIYWVNNGLRLWRAMTDGSSAQQLVGFLHGGGTWIEGIALDPPGGQIYFANNQGGTIVRANLDGLQRTNIWNLGASGPAELEIDIASGNLYWNDSGSSSVSRGNKAGSGEVTVLVNPGTSGYSALHVDKSDGKIYFASAITNLMRANLDGGNVETVLSDPDGIVYLEVFPPESPPSVRPLLNGVFLSAAQIVTNSAMLSFQTTFVNGPIFYTLNGGHPGAGTLYTGPVLVSTSVVVRAIAYNADYTESAESDTVTLTVVHSPAITLQPQTQTVLASQPAVFSALASGTAPLSYQWYFNGAALAGATSSSFVRSGTFLSHAGSYWVVASNPYGSATSAVAGLTVLLRPSIASQPSGTNVITGQNATFCVNAIGSAPLVFQWRKNGVNIPGATNPCYAITNVQATNAGAYSVIVGNGADAVTSAEAELVLEDLPNGPPPEDFFANRNGLFGNSGALEVNNIGATKEAGEPDHADKPGGASVWYAWAPEQSGIATLRTSGSAFDTLLAVYRGTEVAALIPVVANEDGGGFLTSALRFNATNGVEYQIAVDGFAAAQGTFVLSWNLEVTAQVLPIITNQPVSQTVTQGVTAPFSVGASGSGLKYQWYFNGTRINNATNSSFTRTNVQSFDVGYYAVAVTNNQSRGLLSDAAILEIGPFPDVRSTDKVEDLLGGPQPAPPGGRVRFQPASSGFASVAIGSLGTQVLNTTNSTTSFRETNHCGVIGGSSRWFKLKPAANGLMSIDTFGSTFDTVLAAYTGDPLLGGYPTRLIDCNNNAATDARWSRVLYSATNATEYLIAVDGANSAAGTVQLNWSLGLPPVIISNPPPTSPLVPEGQALQLTTALTNGLPPPKLQWYLNGQLIIDATNATYIVGAAQRLSGGTYTVVAYNPVGMVTSIVANVTVEVPLKLNLQPVTQNGKVHFRVSGVASQTFILQGSTNFVNWQPLFTNSAAGAPVNYDDLSTTNRIRRYYRPLPWP